MGELQIIYTFVVSSSFRNNCYFIEPCGGSYSDQDFLLCTVLYLSIRRIFLDQLNQSIFKLDDILTTVSLMMIIIVVVFDDYIEGLI